MTTNRAKCVNCGEQIALERADDGWFHVDDGNVHCGGVDFGEFASPKDEPAPTTHLWVQEEARNVTEGYLMGDSGVYESFATKRGELFERLRDEYGRCTGRVYVDTEHGTRDVGWVFVKRVKYEDSDDTYLREVWVTVHTGPPTRTVTYDYAAR